MENKGRNFWFSLFPLMIVVGIQFVMGIVLAQVGYVYAIATFSGGKMSGLMEAYMDFCTDTGVLMTMQLGYALVAIGIFVPWYRKVFPQMYSPKPWTAMTAKPLLYGVGTVCFVVGMQYLSSYLITFMAIMRPQWMESYESVIGNLDISGGAAIAVLLYSVIFGPICEELAFRGLTMEYAKKAMPFAAANVLQALLFAGLHMNVIQSTYAFFLGLFLGYLCHKSGSLLFTIVLHVAFNFFGMCLSGLVVMESDSPIAFFLFLLLAMTATYAGFGFLRKSMVQKVNPGGNVSDMNSTAQ